MSERLIGLRLVDSDDGRTWLEYRIVGGKAIAVLGGDTWAARIMAGGISLCGAHLTAARGFGLHFGFEVVEGPHFPRDGARFLDAIVGERLTRTGSRAEPITQELYDLRDHDARPLYERDDGGEGAGAGDER